jgi:hypothetical protein
VFAGLVLCFCGWVVFGGSAAGEFPSKSIRIRPICPRQRNVKSPAGLWVVKEINMTKVQIFFTRRTATPTFPTIKSVCFPLSTIEPRTKQDRKRYSVYNLAINRQVYVNLRPIRPHSSRDVPLRIHGNNQQSAGHEPVRPSSLVLFHLGQPRPYTSQSMFSVVVSDHHSVEPHTLSCAANESRRGVSTGWCGVASKILRRSMRGVTQRTRPECG